MALNPSADTSAELLEEFRLESSEQLPRCEQLLIELEQHPQDRERLRELFRLLHTVKGNLGVVGLPQLTPLPQAMEDVLAGLRDGQLQFDSILGDILLLSLDQLRALLREAFGGAPSGLSSAQIGSFCQALHALAGAPAGRQDELRHLLLQQLDPSTRLQPAPPTQSPPDCQQILARHGIPLDEDMAFFIELMQASEKRSHYWQGRGLRLLALALAMNHLGGHPAEPAQLAAAICLHDLGMAFLPLSLLHKQERLSREERRQVHSHPRLGYDLLRRLPQWQAAAEIILQHQEHADGNGYPKGHNEAEIAPGALILAIADTFDARTHERAHQTLSKRPRLRAILEINNQAGRQFSAHWVEVFNRTLQQQPELTRL